MNLFYGMGNMRNITSTAKNSEDFQKNLNPWAIFVLLHKGFNRITKKNDFVKQTQQTMHFFS